MIKCGSWLKGLVVKNNIKLDNLVVGLEDTNGAGIHLHEYLVNEGFETRYVPAILTQRERNHSVHHDKTDYLDAKRVGKVILTKSEETLPTSSILAQEKNFIRELDLILQERAELVREQTALKNQLHALLHQYYGNCYKQEFTNIFSSKALGWYKADVGRNPKSVGESILRRVVRLELISSQITDVDKQLGKLSKTIPEVKILSEKLVGCGALTACKIIAEIGTIKRFSNKEKLAKYAGIAPTTHQSSSRGKVYTNSGGNRKLNQAIHTIALSQIGRAGLTNAMVYYQKKLKEGKSKLWALRCLKRHISNRVFVILKDI